MIKPRDFYNCLINNNFDFFTGVPDSLLKELCTCIKDLSDKEKNIITANEGNSVALACGYNISTSKYGVVYMQNSGLGNTVNPLLSLSDEKVYEIPMLLLIGYRGEPNVKDEPQHIKQGELTLPILDTVGIKYFILDEDYETQIKNCYNYIQKYNKTVTLVIRKDTFSKYEKEISNENNNNSITREEVLETIIKNLVDNKEAVEIKELEGEQSVVYEVKVAENDMGKIIGKQGRLAKSIRTVMKAVASKAKKRVSVEFIG